MQAPTLFVLAADLTKMQVVANLDESDVGRIRPGQHVTFRVDAYPADDFDGTVSQVRLQPIVQQNVVTYATVIDVPNPELKLKPGMTANVNVEIARAPTCCGSRTRRCASARPTRCSRRSARRRRTRQSCARSGAGPARPRRAPAPQTWPGGRRHAGSQPDQRRPAQAPQRSGRGAARGRSGPRPGTPADEDGSTGSGTWRRGGRGGGGRGLAERMQSLSPEERERMLRTDARARLRSGGNRERRGSRAPRAATGRDEGEAQPPTRRRAPQSRAAGCGRAAAATTFDALFGPLPPVETVGRVWLYVDNQLKPVRVRLGITDGQNSELLEGDLQEGTESSPTSSLAPKHGQRRAAPADSRASGSRSAAGSRAAAAAIAAAAAASRRQAA